MSLLELPSCIPYALGHPGILGVSACHEIERKTKMFVKGISRKIFRIIALESCPTDHLGGGPLTVSKKYSSIRLGR